MRVVICSAVLRRTAFQAAYDVGRLSTILTALCTESLILCSESTGAFADNSQSIVAFAEPKAVCCQKVTMETMMTFPSEASIQKVNLPSVLRAVAQSPEIAIQSIVEDGSVLEYLRMASDEIDRLAKDNARFVSSHDVLMKENKRLCEIQAINVDTVAALQRERVQLLAKLSKPSFEREPPHCKSCSCGMKSRVRLARDP